ncbi:MAG: hypothetical protein VX627_05150 [Candidatus Thermoplasmatota archaeon]|nr:hypothetical protein [Candidatus Thermoplasmatota archaeon]
MADATSLTLSNPWLGFWMPLAMICISLGFWLTEKDDIRRKFSLVTFLSAIIILGWWSLETKGGDGAEIALLAVLLNMMIPVGMMATGTLIATFSGPSPVGPLPRGLRPFGFLITIGGLLWITWMLTTDPPDARAHGIGEAIWGAWVLIFLIAIIMMSTMGGAFCVLMGDERHREAMTLALLAIGSAALFVNILQHGSSNLDSEGWLEIYWEEITVIWGGIIGIILAVMSFIGLVYMAERRAPDPDVVAPLSESEKARVSSVLRDNLGVGEAE